MKRLLWLLCFIFISNMAAAQQVDGMLSFGGGLKAIDGEAGIGLDGKVTLNYKKFYADINPLDLTFIPTGPQEGYRSETTSDGRNICRNINNGQFADKANCSSFKTIYAFSSDINYMLDADEVKFVLGVGYRISTNSTPYFNGTILFNESPFSSKYHWYGTLSAGSKFFKAGVGISVAI